MKHMANEQLKVRGRIFAAAIILLLTTALPVQAQTENQAFYIYQNDGHFDGFFYDEVQKISYSKLDTLGLEHEDFVSQEIVTADSTYRIMLSAIDSVGFVQPKLILNPHTYINGQNPFFNDFSELLFYSENGGDEGGGEIWFRKDIERPYQQWYNEETGEYEPYPMPQVGDVFVNLDPENRWSAPLGVGNKSSRRKTK